LSKTIKIRIYNTIILYVVVNGCETWSLIMTVFENKVLRRIFGPKRDEVTRGWRKLHNEEVHNLYSSPNILRMIKSKTMRWAGHIARMRRCIHIGYVGKPQRSRPLGKRRLKWVDNIKMDLRKKRCDGMDWIDLAQDRDQELSSMSE
jgi:hypothetical protein